MNEQQKAAALALIKTELDSSDIVWTRYGSDTKESLAARILKKIVDLRESN